jgi:hypothetical protein
MVVTSKQTRIIVTAMMLGGVAAARPAMADDAADVEAAYLKLEALSGYQVRTSIDLPATLSQQMARIGMPLPGEGRTELADHGRFRRTFGETMQPALGGMVHFKTTSVSADGRTVMRWDFASDADRALWASSFSTNRMDGADKVAPTTVGATGNTVGGPIGAKGNPFGLASGPALMGAMPPGITSPQDLVEHWACVQATPPRDEHSRASLGAVRRIGVGKVGDETTVQFELVRSRGREVVDVSTRTGLPLRMSSDIDMGAMGKGKLLQSFGNFDQPVDATVPPCEKTL